MWILKIFLILLITFFVFSAGEKACAREIVLFDFEKDPQGWEIPDWALEKEDHIAREISISEFHASEGKYSLEVDVDFAGVPTWRGAYVERELDITDWGPFRFVSVDIFLPEDAPRGMRAKIILTVSEDWKWTEMSKGIPLTPGEWVVVKADLTAESMNWRRFIDDNFRTDIKKLGIRIESNGKILYKGPIYIDNLKLSD